MTPLLSTLALLNILLATPPAHAADPTDLPEATIVCPNTDKAGYLRRAQGKLLFPEGFEFYGPARRKIEGTLSLRFPTGTASLLVAMTGNHIRGEHFTSPDYWLLTGSTETGETIRFYLEQRSEASAFGEVYRGKEKLQLSCEITLTRPIDDRPTRPRPGGHISKP